MPSVDPAVSVCMACYNSTPFLRLALDSVLAQTRDDFELIVVDDASSDASPAILREYAARDRRVRPVFNPVNRGIHVPNVQAARLARGRYVAVLDADDVAEPERLADQVALLERSGAAACLSAVTAIDAQGRAGETFDTLLPPGLVRWRLAFRYGFVHSSLMARREALAALDYYDLRVRHAADYDLVSRLGRLGGIAFSNAPLTRYRIHPHSYSQARQTRIDRDAELTALTNAMDLLGRPVAPGVFHGLRAPWLALRDAAALLAVGQLAEALERAYAERYRPDPETRQLIRTDLALRLHGLAARNRADLPEASAAILAGQPALATVLAGSAYFGQRWQALSRRLDAGSEGEIDEGRRPFAGIAEEEGEVDGQEKAECRPLPGG